jgi:hypothetical protein
MITFRVEAEIKDDRQVTLTLPPEVPTGKADLVVTVDSRSTEQTKRPRSSLADWAEKYAEHWGNQLNSEDVEGFTGRRF